MRLVAIVPGGIRAVQRYRSSKFYEHERYPIKVGEPVRSLFTGYWNEETICNQVGHRPHLDCKPHHLPRCRVCTWIISTEAPLAPGEVMPIPKKCGGCWRDKIKQVFTIAGK